MALLAHGCIQHPVQYSKGILCYKYEASIRFLDVHGASETELVIDTKALMAELPGYEPNTTDYELGTLFNYENGILTMNAVYSGNAILVVIDTRRDFVSTPQDQSRIRKILREPIPTKTGHVITDGRYLFCVYAPSGPRVPDWTVKRYDLSRPQGSASTIALYEFLPRGEECRFTILDGWFYAICADESGDLYWYYTQPGPVPSYWNCCRFPIDCPVTEKPESLTRDLVPSPYTPLPTRLEAIRLFRGDGEDVWEHNVCLGLVKDEDTGKLFIVESANPVGAVRPPRADRPYRPLIFPDVPEPTVISWEKRISEIVQDVDGSDYVHQPSAYKMKDQKFRLHVQPSQSFMDVTLGEGPSQQVLHLETASIDRGRWQFPSQGAPKELRDLLTVPEGFRAHFDERSLIVTIPYSEYEDPYDEDFCQLLLVNFDAGIHFPSFKPLTLGHISDEIPSKSGTDPDELRQRGAELSEQLRQISLEIIHQTKRARREAKAEADKAPEAEAPDADPWFSTEEALHMDLKQGFQFYLAKPTAG